MGHTIRRAESLHTSVKATMLGTLALTLAGCGSSTSLGPFQPEITNVADNFQLQATGLTGVSTVETYSWTTTGTSANVNQATVLTGGSASLEILDANGTQVYSHDLTDNGTYQTAIGSSGSWTIRLTLQNARGTLNFRVQKP